jgi:hypothetical protein
MGLTIPDLPKSFPNPEPVPDGWPEMDEAAFCGLPGDIVRTIEPFTEADPAGLLVQTLAMFGNMAGRQPHFMVEADRHGTNLFVAVVGKSSRARKGTSLGYLRRIGAAVDPNWAKERVHSGLSSGEGLVRAVADESEFGEGVDDKRLLIIEDEFSSVLRNMSRYGNTLSTTMRNAWDCRDLWVMTKRSPLKATGPHISIIVQTTEADLAHYLKSTDVFNGFANRFSWVRVRRQKLLPNGGTVPQDQLKKLQRRWKAALKRAATIRTIGLSPRAQALWDEQYARLSADVPGVVGAVTSRAEAQVRRLAAIYSLMDESGTVLRQHLRAAFAVWKYCEQSARSIFSKRSAITTEGRLLKILRASAQGLTRSQISAGFSHHLSADEINRVLQNLCDQRLVRAKTMKTPGRPANRWYAIRHKSEKAD